MESGDRTFKLHSGTTSRVGHIAAEFERLANVLLRRGCGNPALITYPQRIRTSGLRFRKLERAGVTGRGCVLGQPHLANRGKACLYKPQVGHIAAEFERLANVLLGRGCGNPALITYPLPPRTYLSTVPRKGRRTRWIPKRGHLTPAGLSCQNA